MPYRPVAASEPSSGLTPAVRWLITANMGVYFLQLALFGENITAWFALEQDAFPGHWWGVGTYMFVHAGLLHLATNMVMLWMFGPRLERAFGTRSFTYFYLWCGLGGGVFHLLFAHGGGVVGASGAVVGVVLAYALRWPDEEVYLLGVVPMQARWLAVWTIAVNVGMALADMTGYANSTTAWMTHVGGLVFAWLYLHAPSGPGLERLRLHVATVPDEPEPHPIPRARRPTQQEHREHRERREQREHRERPEQGNGHLPQTADEAVAESNALLERRPVPPVSMAQVLDRQERIDDVNALLDKISSKGMQSLTPGERRLLEEASRRLRNS